MQTINSTVPLCKHQDRPPKKGIFRHGFILVFKNNKERHVQGCTKSVEKILHSAQLYGYTQIFRTSQTWDYFQIFFNDIQYKIRCTISCTQHMTHSPYTAPLSMLYNRKHLQFSQVFHSCNGQNCRQIVRKFYLPYFYAQAPPQNAQKTAFWRSANVHVQAPRSQNIKTSKIFPLRLQNYGHRFPITLIKLWNPFLIILRLSASPQTNTFYVQAPGGEGTQMAWPLKRKNTVIKAQLLGHFDVFQKVLVFSIFENQYVQIRCLSVGVFQQNRFWLTGTKKAFFRKNQYQNQLFYKYIGTKPAPVRKSGTFWF
eukprot:TRINITY_DN2618_c0_g1_i1.p3 TRINITY_DN2618_c0_g1~~TRINITY_DN2618_c0_g1_i1.p3  ORF type:complete len:312 (+),score=-7.89 TRINITY_DN2618_c0_g1_i1:255-1190(+)